MELAGPHRVELRREEEVRAAEATLQEPGGNALSQPLVCRWFNLHYVQKMIATGQRLVVFGKPRLRGKRLCMEHPEFEVFGYSAREAYRGRTGRELADLPDLAARHPRNPAGGDWLRPELKDRSGSQMLNRCVVFAEMGRQEYAEIERRFPRTWRYCVEQGIIKVGEE
jgi:hypothetical protein